MHICSMPPNFAPPFVALYSRVLLFRSLLTPEGSSRNLGYPDFKKLGYPSFFFFFFFCSSVNPNPLLVGLVCLPSPSLPFPHSSNVPPSTAPNTRPNAILPPVLLLPEKGVAPPLPDPDELVTLADGVVASVTPVTGATEILLGLNVPTKLRVESVATTVTVVVVSDGVDVDVDPPSGTGDTTVCWPEG